MTENEAQELAKKFLAAQFLKSLITVNSNQLTTRDNLQVYQLEGQIAMRSQGMVDRFVISKSAITYSFNIEIEARHGKVLNYEVR